MIHHLGEQSQRLRLSLRILRLSPQSMMHAPQMMTSQVTVASWVMSWWQMYCCWCRRGAASADGMVAQHA